MGPSMSAMLEALESANEHNYICAWCIHGDCETAKIDLDASECIVCDAKCSCPCGHA